MWLQRGRKRRKWRNPVFQFQMKLVNKNKNSKVLTIKTLLDSGANASIVRKDIIHKRHKILKDKKNKWSVMAGTFKITFVTNLILKLPEVNYSTDIYKKCHNTDKLLNYDLILGNNILYKVGIALC